MKGKKIKSEVLNNLKKGKSKTEIYDEFSPTSDDKELRRILASRPSQNTGKSQRLVHKVICWVWTLIFIMELIGLFDLFVNLNIKALISFAITTYLLVQLWKFNGDAFLPSIVWLILGIFNNMKELVNLSKDDIDYDGLVMFSWAYLIIVTLVIGLTYFVRKNVFSYYHWFKPATDSQDRIIFQVE